MLLIFSSLKEKIKNRNLILFQIFNKLFDILFTHIYKYVRVVTIVFLDNWQRIQKLPYKYHIFVLIVSKSFPIFFHLMAIINIMTIINKNAIYINELPQWIFLIITSMCLWSNLEDEKDKGIWDHLTGRAPQEFFP